MMDLDERQEFTPDGQELPPWQAYQPVTTLIDGVQVITGEIVPVTQTYYGPSIPLGEGWSYGGTSSPATIVTSSTSSFEGSTTPSATGPQASPSSVRSTTRSLSATSASTSAIPISASSLPSTASTTTLATSQSTTSTTTASSLIPAGTADTLEMSTSPLSHTLVVLLPSIIGSLVLSVLLVACVVCYRRKGQYREANPSDPDANHGTSSTNSHHGIGAGDDTGLSTDNSPDSSAPFASNSTIDRQHSKGRAKNGDRHGSYAKLPNPAQVSDESFGDNPLPITLGEYRLGPGKLSESGMYRDKTEQGEKAPFLSAQISDTSAKNAAQKASAWGQSEKATVEGDITDLSNTPPTDTSLYTNTPDRRHLFSKLSQTLGLGIGIGTPPHPRAMHTISGDMSRRYYSPGTAEKYIGRSATSPARLPSWAMIADIGESMRRRISGAAGIGTRGAMVVGSGTALGSPGPSILRNAGGGFVDEKGKYGQSEGAEIGGIEVGTGKGLAISGIDRPGGYGMGPESVPSRRKAEEDEEGHEELRSLVHCDPSLHDPNSFEYPRHIEDTRPTRDDCPAHVTPQRDPFIGTPSILEAASSTPALTPLPVQHAHGDIPSAPHQPNDTSLSQNTTSPQSHGRSMSISESDLFYRKPLTTATSTSTLALARDFFRPGPRARGSYETMRVEQEGQGGTVDSRLSGISGRTGQMSQQGRSGRMGPWQRAEMAGTTTSRSTSSSGNTSFGTGSWSGSGNGSSGPSARSRGRPTPWTRRGGISPADEFGTPLRELADLADQYENAYDYAQHAGMQYLDTGRAGEVEGEELGRVGICQ